MYANAFTLFSLLFLSSLLLGNGLGLYSNPVSAQKTNEVEVNADIEQENKCKKDTECENENELNNGLTITNITQVQQKSQTTLKVIKTVICISNTAVGVSQLDGICDGMGPEGFEITVTGNNPNPSQFPGSETGTLVTLGSGYYTVSEPPSISTEATFSGDCTQIGPFEAEGTIEEGETQTCTINNEVTVTES